MAEKKVTDIQAAIGEQGYRWQASTTSVSELSVAEQKAHLGLAVSKEELDAMEIAIQATESAMALQAAIAAPAAIDWRNKAGDWTTPIKDQQNCGSCVSFAVCATLESRINIACRNANLDPDLSEAHLFFCGCGNCCGTGWNFAPALNFAKNTGLGKETNFPYTPSNQACQAISPYIKIDLWAAVIPVADRKNILATKGPMVAGMAVYADFFTYRSGVYRATSTNLRGYHAVSVVGYDDQEECWICKNSWGTGWGENGWFKIGYGESGIDTQFAFYDVDLKCPSPGPLDLCPRYQPYLTSVIHAARVNRELRGCLLYYVCGVRLTPRPLYGQAMLRVVRRVRYVLMRCPQYRRAFCRSLMR